jgi:hypothetical protein
MNAYVKKELRLLLPGWGMAVLLALPPICTRSDDGIPVFLLFIGLIMMALTPFGRESSLNTFSTLLAQPAERRRIWNTKLTLLGAAFVSVFAVWRLASALSFHDYGGSPADPEATTAVLVGGLLVFISTFAGGLWATLLLRQLAGAFWLAALVPAMLAGFVAAFLSESHSEKVVLGVMAIVLGIYSIAGLLFARWLFFRAQDIGWTGGIIALPELKFFGARADTADLPRAHKPLFALLKKELHLQQVSLLGALGLFIAHVGVIVLRSVHKFEHNSAGEILTAITWMLWMVMPVLIGAMAVAEERRLGTLEGQLCQPASRRMQFIVKAVVTFTLGMLFGGIIPGGLETLASSTGMWHDNIHLLPILMGTSLWLVLVGFFASSMARNFLQAVGFALVTFMATTTIFPAIANGRMIFFDRMPVGSILPLLLSIPTLLATLFILAYLNFKDFREGWALWRRSLLYAIGALLFASLASAAVYHRAWEVMQPAEPAHGKAILTLEHPPTLQLSQRDILLARLPDGHVWFDRLNHNYGYNYDREGFMSSAYYIYNALMNPLPCGIGPADFLAGSNWVTALSGDLVLRDSTDPHNYSVGYFDTVGIQTDGTLWVSEEPPGKEWSRGTLRQFGTETGWRQIVRDPASVLLLKKDGTLWRWGVLTNVLTDWPGLAHYTPRQVGTDSDWRELSSRGQNPEGAWLRKADGSTWTIYADWRTGKDEFWRATNFDNITLETISQTGDHRTAFVRPDGTLWVLNRYYEGARFSILRGTGEKQVGTDHDWVAVNVTWSMMVALKKDGTLWQWSLGNDSIATATAFPPRRLGIHNDWVGIAGNHAIILTLAADGNVWLWPDREYGGYHDVMQPPKQPKLIGNVLSGAP